MNTVTATQWDVFERSFETRKEYANPFVDVEVDVVFEQGGRRWAAPAFWAGGKKWTVRFAPPEPGEYVFHVECSDKVNAELNGHEQSLRVTEYGGENPLLRHGFIGISGDGRHFAHADGTPFLWLADTWWKCLCKRMTWEGFRELAADRKAKGFSVVQIVCGPYPDEGAFEPRWANEGGMPYETRDFTVVNPAYFDYADRRMKHLVEVGIVPAIVGGWGRSDCNCMQTAGVAGLKRHWRYLVARYGALPVMWFVGGEIPEDTKRGVGDWAEVAKYLRGVDPYHHPVTCHCGYGRKDGDGDTLVIDYDMVGGNHDGTKAIGPETLAIFTSSYPVKPVMPMFCGETAYEGHMQCNFQDVQRHVFWMYMLSGAAGHTYGAAGVWHASVEGDPGIRPVYDTTTWKVGMGYPGATQLGLGKRLLERYEWHRFEPHPEWTAEGLYAAGVPGEVRFVYRPRLGIYNWNGLTVKQLERGVVYRAFYFDPVDGKEFELGRFVCAGPDARAAEGQSEGPVAVADEWTAPPVPSPQDWVLVMERCPD